MNYTLCKKEGYAHPQLVELLCYVEQGFALSLENPESDPEQNW
jgi:hypothetical protein